MTLSYSVSDELPYEYMLALRESDEATTWQPFVRPDPRPCPWAWLSLGIALGLGSSAGLRLVIVYSDSLFHQILGVAFF